MPICDAIIANAEIKKLRERIAKLEATSTGDALSGWERALVENGRLRWQIGMLKKEISQLKGQIKTLPKPKLPKQKAPIPEIKSLVKKKKLTGAQKILKSWYPELYP